MLCCFAGPDVHYGDVRLSWMNHVAGFMLAPIHALPLHNERERMMRDVLKYLPQRFEGRDKAPSTCSLLFHPKAKMLSGITNILVPPADPAAAPTQQEQEVGPRLTWVCIRLW